MYIWRRKNRRDRRGNAHLGTLEWKPRFLAIERQLQDLSLREKREEDYIALKVENGRQLMYQYLKTSSGVEEIEKVAEELRIMDKDRPKRMPARQAVQEIFRTFDSDQSGAIDRAEMKQLLEELRIPMRDKEVDALCTRLDTDSSGDIDFEEFYRWFESEGEQTKRRRRYQLFFKAPTTRSLRQGLDWLMFKVDAKNMIMDAYLFDLRNMCRDEFRRARPPTYFCEQCQASFPSEEQLVGHQADISLHQKLVESLDAQEKSWQALRNVHTGPYERRLRAHRLLYNTDLVVLPNTLETFSAEEVRPMLAERDRNINFQLDRQQCVEVTDPTHGKRPAITSTGMQQQHRFGTIKLSEILSKVASSYEEVSQSRVVAEKLAHKTKIEFSWVGYVAKGVELTGDFNAWGREDCTSHGQNTYSIVKYLAPAVYRYRFIVDGEDKLDPKTPVHCDNKGESSLLEIINPPPHDPGNSNRSALPEKLIELDIRNQYLRDDGALSLAHALRQKTSIESIDLSYNGISDAGVEALSQALANQPQLSTLSLCGNGFGLAGSRALGRFIVSHPRLCELHLASNRIGDDGAKALADVISGRCLLRVLSLDANHIHDDGAEHLARGLLQNNTIQQLSLSANAIGERGARAITETVQRNKQLRILNLSRNPLGPVGAQHIGRLLSTNLALTEMYLSHCNVVQNQVYIGLHTIMEATRINSRISKLDLSYNNIPEDAMVLVALAMHDNMYLVDLRLEGNPIDTKWLRPGYLRLRSISQLPTIAYSLAVHQKAAAARSTTLSELLHGKPRQERRHILNQIREGVPLSDLVQQYGNTIGHDDKIITRFGEWSIRRTWMPKKNEASMLKAHQRHKEEAQAQANEEQVFADRFVRSKYRELEAMLLQNDGRQVLDALRRLFCQVLEEVGRHSGNNHNQRDAAESTGGDDDGNYLPSAKPTMDFFAVCVVIAFKLAGADDQLSLPSECTPELVKWLCLEDQSAAEILQPLYTEKEGVHVLRLRNVTRTLARQLHRVLSREKLGLLRSNSSEERVGRTAIVTWLRHQFLEQARAEFRRKSAPRYLCRVCQTAFLTKRRMRRHQQNADRHHAQLAADKRRAASFNKFMTAAKAAAAGCAMPSCFETRLDAEFQMQLLDYLGSSGRPIRTVQGYTCFYAEDSFGSWLKVRYDGVSGWVRRSDPSGNEVFLFPLGTKRRLPAKLVLFAQPLFHKMALELADHVQLKVRPVPDVRCKPSAFLERHHIVEAVAQCGDWLLVRYDQSAGCQWMLTNSASQQLMVPFSEDEQIVLRTHSLPSPAIFNLTMLELPKLQLGGDDRTECNHDRLSNDEDGDSESQIDDNASIDSRDWVNDL